MKTRVWIINQYALPRGETGITRHGDLASVLVKLGYEVTVFASGFDYFTRQKDRLEGASTKPVDYAGVRFVWIKTPPYSGNDGKRVKNMVSFFMSILRQGSFGKYGKPDIILGSSPHLLSGLAGWALSVRYHVPFLFEVRDIWPEDLVDLNALKAGSLTHRLLTMIAMHLYRQAHKIITVPPKAHHYIASLGIPDKCVPLPNGVFIDSLPNNVSLPQSLQDLLSLEKDRFKVIYMGAHGVANDLANVLHTAAYLRQHYPAAYNTTAFFFVGGGQQRDELIMNAKEMQLEHVHFHPPVSKAAVSLVTAQADALLVHLSDAATFSSMGRSPNKLYDYLLAQKPVLFSTLDPDTVLQQANAGLTFAPGRPEAFATALLQLMSMPISERTIMGKRGRAIVEKDYNLELLGKKLANLIDNTLGKENT